MIQLVLHAHMPYVLNTPMEYWLHEAAVNSHLPLIEMLLKCPGAKMVLHISPSLINQWTSPSFAEKFSTYCRVRKEAALSYRGEGHELIICEVDLLDSAIKKISVQNNYLIDSINKLKNENKIEILTGAATHAFLPLWKNFPPWVERQMRVGQRISKSVFGDLRGFWFPECALDAALCEEAEACGLEYAYADASCAGKDFVSALVWGNFTLFLRNTALGDLIWDAETGYPGAGVYRDFHADFSMEKNVQGSLPRAGFSLRAVGDRRSADKPLYCPKKAQEQAQIHARHFLEALPKDDPSTLAFDAELFGHWWHEGVFFLENLFEQAPPYFFVHPKEMPLGKALRQRPLASTWGTGCNASSWINPQTAPLIEKLVAAQASIGISPEEVRAFMLAQASDWPFLISHGSFTKDAQHVIENLLTKPPADKDLLYHQLAGGYLPKPIKSLIIKKKDERCR